jgi:hypothetical protein
MSVGTVNIRGKEYKLIATRVAEFVEARPEWAIETEIHALNDESVVMKAVIKDHDGRVRATGYAEEFRASSNINKTSALENCETSAIGRCLSACGFGGTEYASAEEVANAISNQAINEEVEKKLLSYEQRGKQLANHLNAIRENWSSVVAIKEGIENDDTAWVAECYMELDNDTREALFGLAPTKGGVFTTQERSYLKSDGMNAARKEVANGV